METALEYVEIVSLHMGKNVMMGILKVMMGAVVLAKYKPILRVSTIRCLVIVFGTIIYQLQWLS